tara:strand:- start:155 stop:751 length:597 start_codon:yes stop_codon:yes gene_type:complete
MKKYLIKLLIPLLIISCQKEDDLFVPITETNNTTNSTTSNVSDTTINNINTDVTILDSEYKLVKCTFEYIDNNDQSNNISYFGYPYDEYGVTTNFKNDGTDTILVNMPMYPSTYYNATIPLYLPNGEPEWFMLIVNNIIKTEQYVNMNVDMRRVVCPQFLYGLDFHFSITEDNGMLILNLHDTGDNWSTHQTLRFEPI